MKLLYLALSCFLFPIYLSAQVQLAPKKTLEATRITSHIKLDAVLDEPVWESAAVAGNFLFRWPTPGKAASQQTMVRVLYDDEALYIGAQCFDTHVDSLFHRLSKRDELENTDFFAFVIDAYQDGQNALQFGVTPDNVQFDSKFSLANANNDEDNSDGEDPSWDAVWQSSTQITRDGWALEMKIPYAALRFPKKETQQWNINFLRSVKRRGETDSWNEIKAEISGTLNQMGMLQGITNIKAPLRLSATPFVAAYANNVYNQTTGPTSSWSFPWSIGMDLKYGINEAFTLDATVIPDFGQVRSDQKVLNLSPFEVRFAENRPFFTEGTELFNKGGLFYSRRIGANAQLLNASKISGRTQKGLGIGLFNAVERAESETVVVDGQETKSPISPLTNKSVFVLDQNLPYNSSVTFITTNVLQSGTAPDANVSGVLFNLKNKAQSYLLSGKAVASNRFYPDNTKSGYTISLDVSKNSGNWLWGSEFNLESDRYDPNDLGFLFSPNEISHIFWLNYNRYKPWWKLNNYWASVWSYNSALYQPLGTWTESSFGFNIGGNTRTFHNFGFNSNISPNGEHDYFEPRVFDFVTFYHLPRNGNLNAWYNSDNRKKLIFNANGGIRIFAESGRKSTRANFGIRWRASDKLSIGLEVGHEWATNNVGGIWRNEIHEDALGWETLPVKPVLMGRRDIVGFDNSLNASFSFTNRMNLTLYSRHYWQKAQYAAFYNLTKAGELVPSTYTGRNTEGESLHDVAANYFNIDLVYTWRFAPGSDLLLVYKNGIGHIENGWRAQRDYWHNARQLTQFEGNNNLSIKILYFLDYTQAKKWL